MKKSTKNLLIGSLILISLVVVTYFSVQQAVIVNTSTNYECKSPATEFSYSCSPQATGYNIPTGDVNNTAVIHDRQISVEGFRPLMTFRLDPSVWINVMKRDVPETATFFNSYTLCSTGDLGLYFSGSSSQSIIDSVSYINKGYENSFGLLHYNSCSSEDGCPNSDCYRFWRANDVVSYRMNNNQLAIFKGKVTCHDEQGSMTLYAVGKYNSGVRYIDFEDNTIYITGNNTKFSCPPDAGKVTIIAESLTLPMKVGGYTDEQFKNACAINEAEYCEGNTLFICKDYMKVNKGLYNGKCGYSYIQYERPSDETQQEIVENNAQENIDITENISSFNTIDSVQEWYYGNKSNNYILYGIGIGVLTVLGIVAYYLQRKNRGRKKR